MLKEDRKRKLSSQEKPKRIKKWYEVFKEGFALIKSTVDPYTRLKYEFKTQSKETKKTTVIKKKFKGLQDGRGVRQETVELDISTPKVYEGKDRDIDTINFSSGKQERKDATEHRNIQLGVKRFDTIKKK